MARQFSVTQVVVTATSTVLAAFVIFVTSWLWQNLVFAGDLDAAVKSGLAPVVLEVAAVQTKVDANTTLLMTSIRNGLRADIRDLRKEIQEMEEQQVIAPDTWTDVHELLLDEWIVDLDELQIQLDALPAVP